MADWNTIIQGRTDTHADILINVAKGFLGVATVYALSKTHYATAHIATATTVSTLICFTDFWDPTGKQETYEKGAVPLLRGIQVMAGYYAYTNLVNGWTALALLEPVGHTLLSLTSGKPAITLDLWGLTTSKPSNKKVPAAHVAHWREILDSKTDSRELNLMMYVGKALYGALIVAELSKTSNPGMWIAGAGVAAPLFMVGDIFGNGGNFFDRSGCVPLVRGIQLAVAAYGIKNGQWAIAAISNIDALALAALTKDVAFAYGLG